MKTLVMAILAAGVFGVAETERPSTSRAVSGPTGCESCGSCVCRCRGFGKLTADNKHPWWEPRPVRAVAAVRG